jgi:hypothetical protein
MAGRTAQTPRLRKHVRPGKLRNAPYTGDSTPMMIYLPPAMVAVLDRRAGHAGMKRSYFIRHLLGHALKALPEADDENILARLEVRDAIDHFDELAAQAS